MNDQLTTTTTISYSVESRNRTHLKNQQQPMKMNQKERGRRRMGISGEGKLGSRLFLLCYFIGFISFASIVVVVNVQASGVFELELIKLESYNNDDITRTATNNSSSHIIKAPEDDSSQLRSATKLKRVFVCLKEAFSSQLIDGPCTFGNASIFVASQQDQTNSNQTSFAIQQTLTTNEQQRQHGSLLTNIVRIPITFKWTKSFTIILSVEEPEFVGTKTVSLEQSSGPSTSTDNQLPHKRLSQNLITVNNNNNNGTTSLISATDGSAVVTTNETKSLVDRHILTENEVIPDLESNPNKPWTSRFSRGLKSSLAYRFRLYCASNYYGDGCNTFCRARDDKFGHYKCSPSGQKICLEGWLGQENNCQLAKCLPGCQTNQCDTPDTCKCRAGWTGPRCDQCLTYPGCQNGYCLSPGQCLCHQNWGGVLCDQELNYCSTHEPCKNNATCQSIAPGRYKCNCSDGFTGVNCNLSLSNINQTTKTQTNSPQQQQQITAGCELNPCLNGGICYGFKATSGSVSSVGDRPSSVIQQLAADNKTASSPGSNKVQNYYRCQCTIGWTGDYCQWPESQLSPIISMSSFSSSQMIDVEKDSIINNQSSESNVTETTILAKLEQLKDLPEDEQQGVTEDSRVLTASFVEYPPSTIATATAATKTNHHHHHQNQTMMDMRHIISGVVIASAIGVFMASLLLAWCCLAAFERNGFSFIQMNIIRSATDGCDADGLGGGRTQTPAVRATLKRMQEKIRDSFRSSSKRHIKPETKLSIENVLRPPPSYEESKYQTHTHDCAGVIVVKESERSYDATNKLDANKLDQEESPHNYTHTIATMISINPTNQRTSSSSEQKGAKSMKNLVIRGAIEQKLLQASITTTTTTDKSTSARQTTKSANQISAQTSREIHQSCDEPQMTKTMIPTTQQHISIAQSGCPKHRHLYLNRNKHQQQPIRPNLTERDLKVVNYPRTNNEIVIRAEDLYEDYSALGQSYNK